MSEVKLDLILVRHGNTNGNRRWMVEGSTDTPLNSTGQYQAKLVAARFRSRQIDQVCSSDLSRAYDTAAAIVRENQHFTNESRIKKYASLQERHFGTAEKSMILQHYRNAKKAGFTRRALTHYVPEGGESDDDVRKRVAAFLDNLFEKRIEITSSEWTVVVVSHGITMREMVRCLVEDHNCSGISKEVMSNGRGLAKTPNTGVTEFSLILNKNSGRVISGNCTAFQSKRHLEFSNEIVQKMATFQQMIIYYIEFMFALFLYFLSKLHL